MGWPGGWWMQAMSIVKASLKGLKGRWGGPESDGDLQNLKIVPSVMEWAGFVVKSRASPRMVLSWTPKFFRNYYHRPRSGCLKTQYSPRFFGVVSIGWHIGVGG